VDTSLSLSIVGLVRGVFRFLPGVLGGARSKPGPGRGGLHGAGGGAARERDTMEGSCGPVGADQPFPRPSADGVDGVRVRVAHAFLVHRIFGIGGGASPASPDNGKADRDEPVQGGSGRGARGHLLEIRRLGVSGLGRWSSFGRGVGA